MMSSTVMVSQKETAIYGTVTDGSGVAKREWKLMMGRFVQMSMGDKFVSELILYAPELLF